MNGYDLTRLWYNFKFENPDKVKAIHSDLYFYIVDLWNRLGQKQKIGLPTSVTMQAMNIGSYNTYKKVVNDLIEFGFLTLIQESTNQHQSRVIALSKNDKSLDESLDKALYKSPDESCDKSLDSINEQLNNRIINKGIEVEIAFTSNYDAFVAMRKEIKKPLTERAEKLIKGKLEKLAPNNKALQVEILQQSILNNWQDVFPLRGTKPVAESTKVEANGVVYEPIENNEW